MVTWPGWRKRSGRQGYVMPPDPSSAEIVGMVASLILWALAFLALGLYRFQSMNVIAA
jgi:hypothetical protein